MLWASHKEGGSTPHPWSGACLVGSTESWLSGAETDMNMPETGSKHPRREENCWGTKKLSPPECWHRRGLYQRRIIDPCTCLERFNGREMGWHENGHWSWESPTAGKLSPNLLLLIPVENETAWATLSLFIWSRPNSVHLTLLLVGCTGYLAGSSFPVRVPVACGMTGLSLPQWLKSEQVSEQWEKAEMLTAA